MKLKVKEKNVLKAQIVKTLNEVIVGWVAEYKFHPTRKWRFDYANPKFKVAIEQEGGIWSGGRHNRGKGFLKDMEKYNTATLMGWKVLRYTPQNILQACNDLMELKFE